MEDEDKTLILLSSLPDEGYETFVLILINKRTSFNYSEMTTALVKLELRRKDKECSTSDSSTEVLTARAEEVEINKDPNGSIWLIIANW